MASTQSWGTEKGFRRLCGAVGLELEPFQRRIVREVFAGRRELLVLIPRGNGKTTLFAALALYHLLVVPRARVFLAASAVNQALVAYDVAVELTRSHPSVEKVLRRLPGYREIRNPKLHGTLKVLSSDADRAHGLQPTLALIDELHAHPKDDLYVALKTALGKRPEAQLVTITTAGYDEERVLHRLRAAYLEGRPEPAVRGEPRLTVVRNEPANAAMFEWACRPDEDLADPGVVKRANPASFVTEGFLAEQVASPGLPPWEFARYHANVWTPTFASWLPHGAWKQCFEVGVSIPEGVEVIVGVDVGIQKDTSAVVVLWQRDDLRWVVEAQVWKPPASGLDLAVVEQALRDLADRFQVREVVYDPWAFRRSAEMLENEGLLMVEFPANNARTVPASARLFEAISRRELVHDGDPVLAAHVNAGVKVDTERGWRLAKAKAKRPIDALYALMLAFSQAEQARWDGPLVEVFS